MQRVHTRLQSNHFDKGSGAAPPPASTDCRSSLFVVLPVLSSANEVDLNPGNNSDTSGNGGITAVSTVVLNPDDDGPGSLRRIVNIAPACVVITFDTRLTGVPIMLDSGTIVIDKALTIDASTVTGEVVVSGGYHFRVVAVNTFEPVVLSGLTMTQGYDDEGGGISNRGMLSLLNSTVTGNIAGFRGGGIYNTGSLTLTNTSISNNEASDEGAGLYNESGGAVMSLTNSTVSGNTSYGAGGGLVNSLGTITLEHVTIANNSAVSVGGGDGPDIASRNESTDGGASEAVIIPAGSNLIGINDTVSLAFPEGSLIGTFANPLDALPGPLGMHGGPTQTMLPLIGSLAIDGATESTTLIEDQRGQLRPFGPFRDIGSVEVDTKTIFGDGFEQQ